MLSSTGSSPQRRSDRSRVPSATCPRESIVPNLAASPGRLAWGKVRPQLRLGGATGRPTSAFGRRPFDWGWILTDRPSGTRQVMAPGIGHLSLRRGDGPATLSSASVPVPGAPAADFRAPVRQGAEMRQGAENGSPAENPSRGTAICPL